MAASKGITPQTLGFLTSLNAPVAVGHVDSGPKGSGTGTSGSGGGGGNFLSTLGSVGSRALDILSRPLYAVAAGTDEALKQGFGVGTKGSSIGSEILHGFEGKNKMDFVQAIQDYADLRHREDFNQALYGNLRGANAVGYQHGEGHVNPWAKLGLGLAGDIFLDPTTYVGAGLIKDIIKGPIIAAKAGKEASATSDAIGAINEATKADEATNAVKEAQKAEEATTPSPIPVQEPLPFPKPGEHPLADSAVYSYPEHANRHPESGMIEAHINGEYAGHITWRQRNTLGPNQGKYVIDTADVPKKFQRNGIASRMLKEAEAKLGQPLVHSDDLSPDAQAWKAALESPKAEPDVNVTQQAKAILSGLGPKARKGAYEETPTPPGQIEFPLSPGEGSLTKADARSEALRAFTQPGGPLHPGRDLPEGLDRPVFSAFGKAGKPILFGDGLTKALYVVRAGKKLTPKDIPILKWAATHFPGESVSAVRKRGVQIYKDIQSKSKNASEQAIGVPGPHPESINAESQMLIQHYKAQAAARDTYQGIKALDSPAEQMHAAIAAKESAKGDPVVHQAVSLSADAATADSIPPEIKAVNGAGPTLLRDTEEGISREGILKNRAVLNEKARIENGAKYDKQLGRARDKSWLRNFSHTAGLPNMHRLFASVVDQMRSDIQNEERLYLTRLSQFPQETQNAAWQALKNGMSLGDASPDVAEAARTIASMFNRYLGPNDVYRDALSGTTRVSQSGLDRELVNYFMPKDMKFLDGTVKLKNGITKDFSKGRWINSWQAWEKTDPKDVMADVMSSINKAQTYKSVYATLPDMLPGEISWTAKPGMVEWEHPLGLTKGMYFTPERLAELQNWEDKVNQFRDWNSPVMKQYDRFLNAWKSVVTVMNPVHHEHNSVGDFLLSFMHHPMTSRNYGTVAKIMAAQHKLIKGFNPTVRDVEGALSFADLHSATGFKKALGYTPNPEDVTFSFKTKGGVRNSYDSNQIVAFLHQLGVLPHFQTVEDLRGIKEETEFKPFFQNRFMEGIGKFSETREHFERMAYFLEVLRTEGSKFKSPEAAMEHAAWETRRVHPTGQGLTDFERIVMRRALPFYSWTRNVTPVLLRALAEHPGRATAYFKFNHGLALTSGVPQPSLSQQFPTDQGFPNWLRQDILGPTFGSPGSYEIMDLKDPVSQLFQQGTDPFHALGSLTTPLVQVPLSAAFHNNIASGAPVPSAGSYINQQTPITNLLDRIFNVNIGPGSIIPEEKKGNIVLPPLKTPVQQKAPTNDLTGLVNWLFGTGLLNTGKYIPNSKAQAKAP